MKRRIDRRKTLLHGDRDIVEVHVSQVAVPVAVVVKVNADGLALVGGQIVLSSSFQSSGVCPREQRHFGLVSDAFKSPISR